MARRRPAPDLRALLASETLLRGAPSSFGPKLRVLLASPSSYEVGMGGLGLQAVWESLRDTGLAECDRAFSFAPDGPALLSAAKLSAYDVVGFSLPYELEWVNLPLMLLEGRVPILSADRGEDSPLVIAGGASVTMNPEPLAEIIAAFVIGEFEPIADRLGAVLWQHLVGGPRARRECLAALAELPGLYVPSQPQTGPVRRLVWAGVEGDPRCSLVISPHTVFADRFLIETGRGCPQGCRFCLARQIYGPVRYACSETVLQRAREALAVTGKIGLIGAALSGYPGLEEVVDELVAAGADVSLSSLRADRITPRLVGALRRGGQQTVTVAPEAGTERLRDAVGKRITDDELLAAIAAADAEGLREVKLYFMAGLPSETEADLLAIADLIVLWVSAFPRLRFEVAVSPFVPKPWTPFERESFPGVRASEARLETLGQAIRRRTRLSPRIGSSRWAAVQAALARGGREVGRALVSAARQGGGYAAAKKALRVEGVDLSEPLLPPSEAPWRRVLGLDQVCGDPSSESGGEPR